MDIEYEPDPISVVTEKLEEMLTIASSNPTSATNNHESGLCYVMPYLSIGDLLQVTLVNKEIQACGEQEWRARTIARFGQLRYLPSSYRRIYALRCHFQRKVASNVTARVYLMNTAGDTTVFRIGTGKSLMCSRERADVYNRCERKT
jgi:hypothetical protein